jgi:porin
MLIRRNGTVARPVTLLFALLLASELAGAAGADDAAETAGGVAEAAPAWPESTLSGDWGGARQRLFDAGVQVDLAYTADYLRNNRGGLQRGGAYMGNLNLALQLDGEKLIGWQGGSAYLSLISNSGGRVNLNKVGSFMGVDNLEAPVNRTGIFEAWLQQSFLDDRASLRAGLYPIDSEFYVTDSSGVFVHPSFGMAAEAADFGSLAGPSIYATSSYGARLRLDPDPTWYAMLAVTRGIASERIDTAGPNMSWQRGVGSMLIGEVGFSPLKSDCSSTRPAPPPTRGTIRRSASWPSGSGVSRHVSRNCQPSMLPANRSPRPIGVPICWRNRRSTACRKRRAT